MASPIRKTTKGPGRNYLSTDEGAGMTAADKGRKASFCARMSGVVAKASGPAERAKASLKRWKC